MVKLSARRRAKKAKSEASAVVHALPSHWPRFTTDEYYSWMIARMPAGAIVADWSKHQPHNSYSPPFWYEDKQQACTECRAKFVFTKEEQKMWYEEYHLPIYANATRCKECRAQRRAARSAQQKHMEEAAAREPHPNEAFFRLKASYLDPARSATVNNASVDQAGRDDVGEA